ncbi:MAG: chromosome segregation protein SMC [Myxococcales bacterium]|jgi:chromosome segregation protein|nr:chromosome segregation protein SMC [Myxococcales bacterium]
MHIKKLEISGFKSFVERTVIHFDHDVIGIVGPNGCGKSNIVDAIRWCMGEQSAKHLRGRAMEDVIFNGSDSRPPAGLSEVTLTFDNTNPEYAATLPLEYRDYPEIAVTRRLFRDGTSEYLINKTQVRLRDITELFLGTGVGTKAYSIIEQGRIGQIVSARPEDRRLFIEEAAGVTKYKQRRKQAERKMELTRQNLTRISDIVNEIERTSASLRRQAAKAERYLAYRSELDDLVLHDAAHRLLEFTVVERVERSSLESVSAELVTVRERLESADGELAQLREEAAQIEARTDEASKRAFAADNEVSTLQAENERARDRVMHLEERLRAATQEQQQIQERLGGLEAEREELLERIERLSADEEARLSDAAAEDQALEELRQQELEANEEVQALRREVSTSSAQAAAAEARLDGLGQRMEDARSRLDALATEKESIVGELESLSARKAALEQALREAIEGKQLTQAERDVVEQEIQQLRDNRLESERAMDSAKNELGLKRNRLRALEDLHRRLEGVGAGARALLGKGDPAVLGLVADRIEAPEELTAAFAGLLGERLQYVVVSDPERGIELLDELRASGRGRGHVIPARPPHVAGARRWRAGEDGVLGLLADRLVYGPEDEPLVQALLGDAVLVETARDALAVVERHPGTTAVALDGTVARPEGVISGGGGDDVAAAMVEQKREMHQLRDEIAVLSVDYDAKVESHNQLRARLSELETALERARKAAHEGELAHVTCEKDLARAVSDIERVSLRQQAIETELERLAQSVEESTVAEAECRAQLDELRAHLEQAQGSLHQAEERAAGWRERVQAQAALVTERKVRLAQVKEQTEAARVALERVTSQLDDLTTRTARLQQEAEECARNIGVTAAKIFQCREARIAAAAVAQEAHAELEIARGELEGARQALGAREGLLREFRIAQAELDETARNHEMALQRIEIGLDHLLSSVREKFRGLDLRRVVGDYHARPAPDEEHRRRIDELTKLIDRMGPVNLEAQREHDEAERRFKELNDQKVDIENALAELERAIKHMDRESRRRFKETFDSVNELFQKSFVKNFRGGRAELKLTDPDDLLNSGVDIMAQPPGKKLGNIELMSGGEKALTAVSLIFAIFQHRPSPFCVLDEVDAPLDEANVSRYNEAIRSMTAHSQFILITHIRKTMQSVDVLYGVTMGEPGVSRLVSVKVNDEAQARSHTMAPTRSESRDALDQTQVA